MQAMIIAAKDAVVLAQCRDVPPDEAGASCYIQVRRTGGSMIEWPAIVRDAA